MPWVEMDAIRLDLFETAGWFLLVSIGFYYSNQRVKSNVRLKPKCQKIPKVFDLSRCST